MELIRGLHNLRPEHRGSVVTVGAFDGIHRGHLGVLEQLRRCGEELALPTTAVVFEPLPREYFQPLEAPPRITNLRERLQALAATGIDRVLVMVFNEALQAWSADDFIERVFVGGLGARHIVLGDDFRFGNAREGDFSYAQAAAQRHGYSVEKMDTVLIDGERVSSTRLRAALMAGDFVEAERLLGRPYTMTGRVEYGRQLGRTLDTPTANVRLDRIRSPLAGVFTVRVSGAGLDNVDGVANVGTRPTVDDSLTASLEVHLLDRKVDLYGRRLTVTFLHKLRDEQKFDSLEALKDNIQLDKTHARAWHKAHPAI